MLLVIIVIIGMLGCIGDEILKKILEGRTPSVCADLPDTPGTL